MIKNFILKGITTLAVIVGGLAGCCLNSEEYWLQALLVIGVCAAWVLAHYIINEKYYLKRV